ncbi:hypothetical protein BDV29DRAFT_168516 [Aspergillus leporis]|uniref:Secreted protein n=1 Tax=Aspergillus leporis TaxID=41062 RepID=A0A5N5X8X3_9EURO|nr:hypothetical protein BDV29DRAFT_168516 [Aspergillus leporis]
MHGSAQIILVYFFCFFSFRCRFFPPPLSLNLSLHWCAVRGEEGDCVQAGDFLRARESSTIWGTMFNPIGATDRIGYQNN